MNQMEHVLYIFEFLIFQGGMHPGKLNPSHTSLYVSYGGKEVPVQEYEILVQVKSLSFEAMLVSKKKILRLNCKNQTKV